MYIAEAMVAVDRIADSVTHLNPENVTDISLVLPETKQEQGRLPSALIKFCISF